MLLTKSIYLPRIKEDGLRISIMSRHTLSDGVTPDPKIKRENYDVWLKILAPPTKLVGDYYKRSLSWEEYEREYLRFLRHRSQRVVILHITNAALSKDITLLCVEENPEKCHRRLLAEECKRYNPDLALRIG